MDELIPAISETRPSGWTWQDEAALRDKLGRDEQDRWPILEPFPEIVLADAPFPVEALPTPLDQYVRALADSLQVPLDMVGVTLLGMLSVCAMGNWIVDGGGGWTEPVCLFSCVVAAPGERKSAVLSAMSRPLLAYQSEQNEADRAEIEVSQAEHEALRRRYESLQKKLASGAKGVTMDNVTEAALALSQHEVKHPLRLMADDVTEEKLAVLMQENGERMAVVSAEGGILETLSGKRYSNGASSFDLYLKSHASDFIQVDRLGREPVTLIHPKLTVVLMIQPSVLADLTGNDKFEGKGLTARFLYSYPASKLGKRVTDTYAVPYPLTQAYTGITESLLDIRMAKPGFLTLSAEAQSALRQFRETLEPDLDRQKGQFASMTGWASKLPGAVLRIAGLIHCVEHRDEGAELYRSPVSGETMRRALQLGYYFLAQAAAIFSQDTGEEIKDARAIWDKLEEKDCRGKTITAQAVQTMTKHLVPTATRRKKALQELEGRGYIHQWQEQAPIGGGRGKGQVDVRPVIERDKILFI